MFRTCSCVNGAKVHVIFFYFDPCCGYTLIQLLVSEIMGYFEKSLSFNYTVKSNKCVHKAKYKEKHMAFALVTFCMVH